MANSSILIVGLGNPGKKYQKTRHNVGFQVIDKFSKENKFPKFKSSKRFNALISEKKYSVDFNKTPIPSSRRIILAKPQTFMNESGKSVKSLVAFYKIRGSRLIVVHDDLDLVLGRIKISKNRGPAGHKGVQSIIDKLNTLNNKSFQDYNTGQAKNFIRFRIGIQPKTGKPKDTAKFVLEKFTKEEEKIIKQVIKQAIEKLEIVIKTTINKAH